MVLQWPPTTTGGGGGESAYLFDLDKPLFIYEMNKERKKKKKDAKKPISTYHKFKKNNNITYYEPHRTNK